MSKIVLHLEHKNFILLHYKGLSTMELTQKLNEHFDTNFKETSVQGFKGRNGLKSGYANHTPNSGCFKKGNVPFNKGKKGCCAVGCEKGWFKAGHRPSTTHPVGTELQRSDGYTWIKIAEPRSWKEKHRIIWEAENGAIPAGHIVTFFDGNKSNFAIENLSLISREENAVLNRRGLRHKELEGTGFSLAKLIAKTGKMQRSLVENNRG